MKKLLAALAIIAATAFPAAAQEYYDIDVDLPEYPQMQPVPESPVYYAPGVDSNYFFYDGLYWVYDNDGWYASSWYNGPWHAVDRFYVPDYILRVPVRYYRHAPAYFHGWRADAAPHWGEHWGTSWAQKRYGWDRWNRSSAPAPAPLPTYQRQYSGNRYPQVTEQTTIHTSSYRYQPKESVAREHYQVQRQHAASQPQPPKQHGEAKGHEQGHSQGKGHEQGKGKGHDKDRP